MKFFNVFVSIIGLFVIVFLVSLFFPRTYKISSSISVNVPANKSFDFLNNIKNWSNWSPWNKSIDSTIIFFYSTADTGVNAAQYFYGKNIGHGSCRINNSITNKLISYSFKLHFNETDFISSATFYFKPQNNYTLITWIDSGDVGLNPVHRFMLPTKIKSTQQSFDEGLVKIKKATEKFYQ